ncbi:hypothetical protein E6C50_02760 [Flavobacterium supellecticarium]|uniref:Uncharacterized protein n=1 Tax=Flavobacterium supellecticarium TaxID=2565924 RepID=A0A4S4A4C8_9FLAO|nr:hypothetical protein [Flavobacterium supellecticarium]THF53143.1 hypothetical protein E6C50_02760 [Flavobacterium supellecticarium]
MRNFRFNKIYVIESLDKDEQKTGKDLYDDILRWRQMSSDNKFTCEYKPINNKVEYETLIAHIEKECEKGIFPILHFEIHGLSNKSGLVLNNNETITYSKLTEDLSKINIKIGNNLFLTLAVCHGAYLLGAVKINKPAPFLGFIGSFETINNDDILYRYTGFYNEFLTSFDLSTSLKIFFEANHIDNNKFSFIDTEETFMTVYKNYIKENTSKKGIKKRIEDAILENNLTFKSRQEKRKFGRDFEKELNKTKQKYYSKHKDIFFMIKDFPENKERFKLARNYSEIINYN